MPNITGKSLQWQRSVVWNSGFAVFVRDGLGICSRQPSRIVLITALGQGALTSPFHSLTRFRPSTTKPCSNGICTSEYCAPCIVLAIRA